MNTPPEPVAQCFTDHLLVLPAQSPGNSYIYEIGEKDRVFGTEQFLRFDSVRIKLHDVTPKGTVLADIHFFDDQGSVAGFTGVDLLKLIPKIETRGDMAYAEVLEEEYNRFGFSFREEHNEFTLITAQQEGLPPTSAYRASLTNNCLAASKWEFALTSTDFSNFDERVNSPININQNRVLSHSWFYLKPELYRALFELKNPGLKVRPDMAYDSLSYFAEQAVIDYEQLRNPIRRRANIEILEIGHKSGRPVKPLDTEQHWKREAWLLIDSLDYTYASILEQTVRTAQFKDEGYYKTDTPREFDWSWMKYVDEVNMDIIDVPGSDNYVELTFTGQWAPYEIRIGNIDLSLLDEQKLSGSLFGVNTYPKSRRYNPMQNTRAYDPELIPDEIKPYLYMTTKEGGKWVNNQWKGIEKLYLGYESLEGDVLQIYMLSYERITPVWMARVKLSKQMRETIRIRKKIYGN